MEENIQGWSVAIFILPRSEKLGIWSTTIPGIGSKVSRPWPKTNQAQSISSPISERVETVPSKHPVELSEAVL
jgi:hypothetical protein